MICAFCHTDTVRWRGPLSNLTHTQCDLCGRKGCERHEPTEEADDGEFIPLPRLKELTPTP